MPERTVEISFPIEKEILASMDETREGFTEKIRFLTALYLYRNRRLSLGKAAEWYGVSRVEFIERLQEEDEPVFDYDDDEMREVFEKISAPQ
jgi:predicted HTH domain antitoxin